MLNVSIMQGRLSPAQGGRIQFFPTNWEQEFQTAKDTGFSGITWFLDPDASIDPIADVWTNDEMLTKIDTARKILPIHSIDCGLLPLFGANAQKTLDDFSKLLPALAPRLESKVVCLALLLHTAPKTDEEKNETVATLKKLANIAQPLGLKLALEVEMSADQVSNLLTAVGSPNVGVCYDVGSAVTYGFDPAREIAMLGDKIIEVHLKDHKQEHVIGKDRSVLLGTGNVDFGACFGTLQQIAYRGGYTMQAARGEDYLGDATRQLTFIREISKTIHA